MKYHAAPGYVNFMTLTPTLQSLPFQAVLTCHFSTISCSNYSVPNRPLSYHLTVPYVLVLSLLKTLRFLNRNHTIHFNFTKIVVYPTIMFDMGILIFSISRKQFSTKFFIQLYFSHFRNRNLL